MQPLYFKNYVENSMLYDELLNLNWEQRVSARKEYFMGFNNVEYTYSNRTYVGKSFIPPVYDLMNEINKKFLFRYNVCFLNRYDTQHEALGWHADAADTVSVISVGAEREIWWKPKNHKGKIEPSCKQLLESGSLFIMPSGFQDLYFHKIPKHDKPCGTRISLTFRTLP